MRDFWDTTLLGPLAARGRDLLAVLPNLLAMLIILSAGWVVAWGAGFVLERLLRVVGMDHLCNRLGVNAALLRGGVKTDPSRLAGRAVYWGILTFAAMAGLQALNLAPITQAVQGLLAYIPRLFMAALIVSIGYLLSNFVSQATLIAAVNANLPPARLLAAASRWGVQLVAAAMAFEQLGIAEQIVVVGFGIAFGGVVLAAALAFGLGAKDLAKDLLDRQFSRTANRTTGQVPDDLRHL